MSWKWPDSFSRHPIFASTSAEPAPAHPSNSQTFALLRKNELLVAYGRELRIASLVEAKSRVESNPPQVPSYKTLQTPVVNFEIRTLIVNATSKLLAVIGETKAAVVVLPRKGWNHIVGDTIDVHAIRVGKVHLSGRRIVQARWHPYSADNAALLILTEDGFLHEYDLGDDADEPTQILDLRSTITAPASDTTFDLDEDNNIACSFCFASGPGWGALTVYALMQDGTISSINPYVPKKPSFPADYLQTLVCLSEIASGTIMEGQSKIHDADVKQPTDRIRAKHLLGFAQDLLQRSTAPMSVQSEQRPRLPPRSSLRGPYLLQPAPRELHSAHDRSASDLVALHLSATRPFNILLSAHNDGRVHIFLHVEAVTETEYDVSPRLITLETIDLGLSDLPGPAHPRFIRDAARPSVLHVSHAHGIHCIDVRSYIQALAPDTGNLGSVLQSISPSEVSWRLRTPSTADTPCPVYGCAVLHDVYLGKLLLAQMGALHGIAQALAEPGNVKGDSILLDLSPPLETGVTQSTEPGYIGVLRKPAFVPAQVHLTTRPRMSGLSGSVSTTSLQDIGKAIEGLRNDIRSLVDALNAAQDRLRRQLTELPRQAAKLQELRDRLGPLSDLGSSSRLEKACDAQGKLLQRSDHVLQQLMQAHQPDVSEAERNWFAELARLRSEVDRGFRRRIDKLNETLRSLKPKVNIYAESVHSEGPLGSRQVRAVEAQLLHESRLIDNAKAKVEELNTGVTRLTRAR